MLSFIRKFGSGPKAEALEQELRQIDWSHFETAYGIAKNVPQQLVRLFAGDHAAAMNATHELWCGLCHQHAYVSSAAMPALPFLLRALDSLDNKLKIEVLDIICGFAICTSRDTLPDWERQLRHALLAESARFEALTRHQDGDIADWGGRICEALGLTPAK